jgi:hypothetical protein
MRLVAYSRIFLALAFLWLPALLCAQTLAPLLRASHPLAAEGSEPAHFPLQRLGVGTFRILAVMVEFQADTDPRTTGNGQFGGLPYLVAAGDTVIDPLPHDRAYFQRKLEFLKNYFETCSDGKTQIRYSIPERIYRVSKVMSEYSPRRGEDNRRLAELVREVWTLVDAQSPEIDFSQFDCFIIFHAGVGRDIDLVSLLGADPTPFDLPSLTFNLSSFRRVFGSAFNGFAVRGGVRITNTSLLPATETREVEVVGGRTLIELSTNGLLCASFASFLGVPDLFNTTNGRSGIGRFGLLDGEGFFNYNGALPPEPSAWERLVLGWATPVDVLATNQTLRLYAQGLHQQPDSVIYRVPISSREYFLLENRQRNARGQGITLTLFQRGQLRQLTFTRDEPGFSFGSISKLDGQIVACSNYEWTLPGATIGNRQFDGGVLIWRISEDLIAERRESNRINALEPRAVFLLEADGSQDIGQNYGIQDAGNGTQSGVVFDAFFQGNIAPFYRNFIDDNTAPSTRSARNAPTQIRFSLFSAPAPIMTAQVQRGSAFLRPLPNFPLQLSGNFDRQASPTVLDSLVIVQNASGAVFVNGVRLASFSSRLKPAARSDVILGASGDTLMAFLRATSQVLQRRFSAPITALSLESATSPEVRCRIGTAAGTIFRGVISSDGIRILDSVQLSSRPIVSLTETLQVAEDVAQFGTTRWTFGQSPAKAAAATGLSRGWIGTVILRNNTLLFLREGGETLRLAVPAQAPIQASPVFADLEHRGELAVLVAADDKIFAYTPDGIPVTNFPIRTFSAKPLAGSPIVADLDGDTFEDIILHTTDGRLLGYNRRGELLFATAIAENTETTPAVSLSLDGTRLWLYSLDRNGFLQGFELPRSSANVAWFSLYANARNSNTLQTQRTPNWQPVTISEFFPAQSVYNYPNPAREQTHFRFFLRENTRVTIQVFSLTGKKIWEQTVDGRGGTDNEVTWNLADVQSGIYYAVLTPLNRESESVRLKVAVVK